LQTGYNLDRQGLGEASEILLLFVTRILHIM
jgi:hypothetical protein